MPTFNTYKEHIAAAQSAWAKVVKSQDIVIDATCGNGHDTLFLTSLNPHLVYALDIQKEAITATSLLTAAYKEKIKFIQSCHSLFPEEIQPSTVKLIIYNLGYLPGGNKSITTQTETTLASLKLAENYLVEGGMISVMCYPGHSEGKKEENALLAWAENLTTSLWKVCHYRWLNRPNHPSLLLVSKTIKF